MNEEKRTALWRHAQMNFTNEEGEVTAKIRYVLMLYVIELAQQGLLDEEVEPGKTCESAIEELHLEYFLKEV
jgi:hypothetical protein